MKENFSMSSYESSDDEYMLNENLLDWNAIKKKQTS